MTFGRTYLDGYMSKKRINWKGPIVGGVAGAFGGILGAADAESMLTLGTMGGLLGALVGYSLAIKEKKTFPTGREVDFYLNSTPLIEKYIKHKVDRGLKVEGNLHFLSRKEYEQRCFTYVLHQLSEGGELPHGKEGAIKGSNFYEQAREAAKRSPGFQSHGQIYINQETAEAGTVIHESIHLFQEVSYASRVDIDANEGTTEYFTRLICAEHQIRRRQKYPRQYECIKKLVSVCGEDKLAAAYFRGNILALEMAVDASKGDGTFQMWTEFMDSREFSKANRLLVI
jgi:hypothetical protein